MKPGSSHSTDPAVNVMFVHGWGCSWHDWSAVTEGLPPSVGVGLAMLPGSPGGVPFRGSTSLQETAAHVISQADALGFDRFALVGHSMGARIALEMAANWPDRVSHLLLVDGSNVPEDPVCAGERLTQHLAKLGKVQWAARAIDSMLPGGLTDAQKNRLLECVAEHPDSVLVAYYEAMAAWDRDHFTAALERVSCPIELLQATSLDESGERHSISTCPHSRWLEGIRGYQPGAVVTAVPNCGHFIMLEHPELIAAWLEKTVLAARNRSPQVSVKRAVTNRETQSTSSLGGKLQ